MQAVAGEQGSAGAGLPPGQKLPTGHGALALAALVEPAAQPKPGGAAQAPEQAEVASPGEAPNKPAAHVLQAAAPTPANVPGGHTAQEELEAAPLAAEAVPAGQGVGVAAPGGQKLPAAHSAQVALDTAPTAALAVPGGHSVGLTVDGGQ